MLLVHTVTPAKLHKVMGVELARFSGAVSGCRCNAAGTLCSADVGQVQGQSTYLAEEHSEDCPCCKKETYNLATAMTTVLLGEVKEISNFARYLLLGKPPHPELFKHL